MHLTLCFLSWALFLSGSLAEMCYECTNMEPGAGTACVEGNFDRNALPSSVKITNCGEYGCLKMVVAAEDNGVSVYKRSCGNPMFNENKCYDPKSYFDISKVFEDLPIGINMKIDQTLCVCHGDYCNGAVTLTSRQAIMGVVAGVLTIVLMQH